MTLARLALLLTLLAPLVSHAAALGKYQVFSRPGQPLRAEIEIDALKPGEERSLAAFVASREAHAKAGIPIDEALYQVRLAIGQRNGRYVVRVRTTQAVAAPELRLVIDLRSTAGRSLTPYTIALEAKAATTPQPAPRATAAPKPSPAPRVEAKEPAAAPSSREALFGLTPSAPPTAPSSREALFGIAEKPAAAADTPTRESLFGLPSAADAPSAPAPAGIEWRGFIQSTNAYTYEDPDHWSRAVIRTQLGAQGGQPGFKWRATARLDLDPVYAADDFYPPAVRKDQRRDLLLRETYVDTKLGGLDVRLGKQNIVWGEMVGLFFADVVSARDQRDFILPEFEIIRIPQWALRVERFGERSHAEIVWLPSPEVDDIGKPGAEFYPVQGPAAPGFAQRFLDPVRPSRTLRNSNLGLRASTLRDGWDLSAFYYRSTDVSPTFYREVVLAPAPTVVFVPRHDRIWQLGGTLGKDLGASVAKAELIYTSGRRHPVSRLSEPGGVVPQDSLDWVVGLDFTFGTDTRLNLQLFERVFLDYDPDLLQDRREGGITLLLATKWGAQLEPELLLIRSTNRSDRLVRAKLGWLPARNWRITTGVDVFSGPADGLFGRFNHRDRAYLELRRDF